MVPTTTAMTSGHTVQVLAICPPLLVFLWVEILVQHPMIEKNSWRDMQVEGDLEQFDIFI